MKARTHELLSAALPVIVALLAILALVVLLTTPAQAQAFEVLSAQQIAMAYWNQDGLGKSARQSSERAEQVGAVNAFPPLLRITASRQPISVLRAVTKEKPPEGAGLYSVRACNLSATPISIDSGRVEQSLEARGIAMTTRPLAALAVKRARSRGLSILAKVSEVAVFAAAPMALGAGAAGIIKLNGWQSALVAAVGPAIQIISDAGKPERDSVNASIGDLGAWLSDAGKIALGPGECSVRLLALGSYAKGQAATLVIEE